MLQVSFGNLYFLSLMPLEMACQCLISFQSIILHYFFLQNVIGLSVHYPGIGTFYSSDFFHIINRPYSFLFLPQSPTEIEPTFTLYTRNNPQVPETIEWNNTDAVRNSQFFNASLPIKIIIHGYMENRSVLTARWMNKLKNGLLHYGAFNIFLVAWQKGNGIIYDQAAVNTRVIGPMVALQIQAILTVHPQYSLADIHLIGFSLGAHVAGYAGKYMQKVFNGTIGQITGLDPAGPLFEGLPPEATLWHTDALFVEALHANAQRLVGLGIWASLGHVDVYINGGRNQPGCGLSDRLRTFTERGFFTGYLFS